MRSENESITLFFFFLFFFFFFFFFLVSWRAFLVVVS